MSLTQIIGVGLEAAFVAADDLVKDSLLRKFDKGIFNPLTLTSTDSFTDEPCKAVLYKQAVKISTGVKRISCKALIKTNSVLTLSLYSKLIVDGVSWDLEEQIAGSEFHVLVNLSRTGNV